MSISRSTSTIIILFLVAGFFLGLSLVVSSAESGRGERRARPNDFDIRLDKRSSPVFEELTDRSALPREKIDNVRHKIGQGEKALAEKSVGLKIERSRDLDLPEVIGTDVKQGKEFLTSPSNADRQLVLKDFISENQDLFGFNGELISQLEPATNYKNPESDLSFASFRQVINGFPVFRGEVRAAFSGNGQLVRVINSLVPIAEGSDVSDNFGDPTQAVRSAAVSIGYEQANSTPAVDLGRSTDKRFYFGSGDRVPTAEKIYFPLQIGVFRPSWQVIIWEREEAFLMIVDGETGTLLWRKNLNDRQTESATFNVYANSSAMVNIADSPFPFTPGPTSPNGSQGSAIARTLITRVGNEPPYDFNSLGWIPDGVNITDGNAVQAGLDRDMQDGVDATNGVAVGIGRSFNFAIDPGIPTNPAANGGDSPLPAGTNPTPCVAVGTAPAMTDSPKAVVTQLFYVSNWFHDETYRLGFNEQAGNFQNDNFGRGGFASDRVSAEAQDCSNVNNAGFSTPPDGSATPRGRMQMYLWTAPTPDIDGSLDADIVIHELTHGLSNRLHSNATGLGGLNMSRAMGEGWSDFFAHAMLSEPSDPINGIYPTGGYAKYGSVANFNNYYYGVRRFPKAVMSFVGPNGRPHNPLTFNDIDTTKIDLTDGAFAPAFNTTADGVHAGGEIWSSALWEIRARYIQRLGWAAGNRRILQHVVDGMKLAPILPTFISERDAMLAAVLASGTAEDVKDVWAGFAVRGLGSSASIQNTGGIDAFGSGTGATRVTEAFDLPNLQQVPYLIAIDTATGNANGSLDPGETVKLRVALLNQTGNDAQNTMITVAGVGQATAGTIVHGQSVFRDLTYTVPKDAACGSSIDFRINVSSSLGPITFSRPLIVGSLVTTFAENFDGVAAPDFPAGWSVSSTYAPMTFVTTTNGPDSSPNSAFAADLPSCSGAGCPTTDGGGTDLTSPSMFVTVPTATLSFRHRYNTEMMWDGGVLEISIAGDPFVDIAAAGGVFLENGYNSTLGISNPNPLGGRTAWTGDSGGYLTTVVRLPPNAAGQNVAFRWRLGSDNNSAPVGGGWNIDNIQFAGSSSCSASVNARPRADLDGDGRSDLSVFRPSENNWYIRRSSGGIDVRAWGLAGDRIVPGYYDQDARTDLAVFRPSENRWYVLGSSGNTISTYDWGLPGDIPVAADYNGDGRTDPAVFRPSDNKWYSFLTSGGIQIQEWGLAGDIPVPGDFDGDGKADPTVYRNGQWFVAGTSNGVRVENWGLGGDRQVPADFDGDGRDDFAVFRGATGNWHILRSGDGGITITNWGISGDIPVPADYDGDGKADLAVYRGGTWYVLTSTGGIFTAEWGLASDRPVPAAYIP